MNGAVGKLRSYPMISKWLSPWLEQLGNMSDINDYRGILSELEQLESGIAQEEHDQNLKLLDYHLCIASTNCKHFDSVFSEKRSLGSYVHEANRVILDKLAEIRAIVGLYRFGFEDIEFIGTPDFIASFGEKKLLIEVTRLGASTGKRSNVWDYELGSIESGIHAGLMVGGGKSDENLPDAIYREVEGKYQQLKNSTKQADGGIVWISLGRDYLTAGLYELLGVGTWVKMSTPKRALDVAIQQIRGTGLYVDLSHVVLSMGRDNNDLVQPELGAHD